jgi:uncharacterized protein (UPF0276 family)
MGFDTRVAGLPVLGLGVSTEYGAAESPDALDVFALRQAHPTWARFLEVGIETAKGLDPTSRSWIQAGWQTTYHFLDVNLDEPEDLDPDWLDQVRALCSVLQPAWLCGDAGLWHFGPRERGSMLLLPPILTDDSATAMAEGIVALREATGMEVLPENPPGTVFLGDLHLLDFFARVAERADTGLLLDLAHLHIYQMAMGHQDSDGLDHLPRDRVVELHVAGGVSHETQGFAWIEDNHTPQVLPETWALFEELAPTLPNLKAVVFECERNPLAACVPGFRRIADTLQDTPLQVP